MERRLAVLVPIAIALAAMVACSSTSTTSSTGSISTNTTFVSFPGTDTSTISLTSSGTWTASTDQSWLAVSPTSGSGSATVTLTVDRAGLAPGSYAGSVLVKSGGASKVVTVYMRFAQVSGNITGPTGQVLPQGVRVAPAVAPGTTYAPGQVLVKVSADYLAVQGLAPQSLGGRVTPQTITGQAVRSAAAGIAQAHSLSVQSLIAPSSSWAVLTTDGQSVAQAVTTLRDDDRVAAAQPNYLLHLVSTRLPLTTSGVTTQSVPTDGLYPYQWDMTVLGMPGVWDTLTGSTDEVVAVVDTGVMGSHPDLQANVPYDGYDFVLNQPGATTPPGDGEYHGTHVAGTIGAVADNVIGIAGMDWHVSILPVRVCDKSGCPVAAIARGIDYAAGFPVYDGNGALVSAPTKARVINLSLGGGQSQAIDDAIGQATGDNTVVVAAAGNDGNCTNPPQFDTSVSPFPVIYPAADPDTIAVGSADADEGSQSVAVSCFSDGIAPSGGQGVTVLAPGGWLFSNGTPVGVPANVANPTGWAALGIVSTWWDNSAAPGNQPTYASLSGTSMATPHVVGLAALMLAENPALTPTQVKLMLEQTANGSGSYDTHSGYGLVSPADAVAAARNSVTANASDFIVELLQNTTLIEQARADAGGNFTLTEVPAGTYTVEAGNDANHNGVLGDVGEFYGETTVTVDSTGDISGLGLDVHLQ